VRTRVKICGITRLTDATEAAACGADALGFVFWPDSPRVVTAAHAREIGRALPALVSRVGVFVNQSPADVRAIVVEAGLDVIQLHGDEDVAPYADLGVRVIKAVHLDDEASVARAREYPDAVTPLVDVNDRVRRGGTGQVANWVLAAQLAAGRPVVLAGGLRASNVAEALRRVRPWAIDVSSGVESSPGIKDAARLRGLFAAVMQEGAETPWQ
jgi:phosphoribosylanthranilate isomerase